MIASRVEKVRAEKDEEIKEAEEIIKNLEAENDRLTKLIESLKVSDD